VLVSVSIELAIWSDINVYSSLLERTKNRPLASGRVSVFGATVYLAIQYIIGIVFFYFTVHGVAYVLFNHFCPVTNLIFTFQVCGRSLPASSTVSTSPSYSAVKSHYSFSRFAIYPLLKRVTYWPQAWLGIAMNFGFITAWVATTGTLDRTLLPVAMTAYWWYVVLFQTGPEAHRDSCILAGRCCMVRASLLPCISSVNRLIYPPDTIYACQDIKDDLKMGVRSTAILFGSWIRPLLICCAVIFVAMLAGAGFINQQGPAYFVLSVGGTAAHLLWQFLTVDLEVPESCWSTTYYLSDRLSMY